MKIDEKIFTGHASVEFQEEKDGFLQDLLAANAILKVSSQKACRAFIDGSSLRTMKAELLEAFEVSAKGREAFGNVIGRMLENAHKDVGDHFIEVSQKAQKRLGKKLTSYEWDSLKDHAQRSMKDVACGVVQLWQAHGAMPVRGPSALKHNL